jgi:cation/acetate symporter
MFTPRTRLINPRLGTYFGIFTSAFVGIALLSLILEQLGVSSALLSLLMLTGPLVLYAAIGLATFTREPLDYFAAGRRVPAAYSGAGMAVTATGATGLLAFTGTFFHLGFDGLCLLIGVLAGFVVMAVLLAPFLRKFGAYTIPSYLGRRFESRMVRVVAAALLAVPMLLVLAAEVRMGAFAAALLTGRSEGAMASLILLVVFVMLVAGGVRALTWSSVAAAIAALIAFLVPVAIIAVLRGDLPLVQLGHGPLLRSIGRDEAVRALEIVRAAPLDFNLPGLEPMAVAKRYAMPFGEVGSVSFVLTILTLMAGVASAPWLLPRVASSPGVYEARKSLGWATVLFGIAMLTATAIAIYMRSEVMELAGSRADTLPAWLSELQTLGLAGATPDVGRVAIKDLRLTRDGIVLALPIAAGLPAALVQLAAAGVVAAAVASAGAAAVALGNALSEDVFHGLSWETQAPAPRLLSARVFLAIAAALGGLVATAADGDPLKLLLWAFAITGASGFPVLVLSIWWKRLNAYGVAASLVSGFGLAVLAILAAEAGWLPISSLLAGIVGLPVAVVVALAISVVTPAPSRHMLELVRETRIPGGEILYDREMRLQRLKRRSPA